ncbi:MAG: DUF6660 family protein [Pyrinomonadaceae bacterium]
MRSLTLVLFAILLFLSVQPCEDVFAGLDSQGHRVASFAHLEQPAEDGDSDNCSPLCICSCCSMSVVSRSFGFSLFDAPGPINFETEVASYRDSYQTNSLSEIWQPPKA